MKNMLRYILAPIAGCMVGMLFLRFISDNIDIGDCMYMFFCAIIGECLVIYLNHCKGKKRKSY